MNNSLDMLVDQLTDMKTSEKKASRIRDIVSVEEWVNSEYYVGEDVLNLYQFWKEHLITIFNSPVRINEIVVDGSLGTGKTTFANVVLLRLLYELSCYSNVPALFNLMASSKMMFAYFNLNLAQAEITRLWTIERNDRQKSIL